MPLSEAPIVADPPTASAPEARGLVSIVLATLNERDNIVRTVTQIFQHVAPPVEVIVVDDDSPDETWRVVQELRDPRVTVIRRQQTRGLAAAFLRGVLETRGAVVGWMDADTCMPPELLPKMLAALKTHDIAIGSRYAPGGRDARHPLRVQASRFINGFASWLLGQGIRDYDSGFIVLRRSVFDRVLPIPTGYGEYFIEFLYACHRKGLTVCEVPYVFTDRTHGASKSLSSLRGFVALGWRYVMRIIGTRLRRIE